MERRDTIAACFIILKKFLFNFDAHLQEIFHVVSSCVHLQTGGQCRRALYRTLSTSVRN